MSTSRGRGSLDLEVSRGTVAIIISISHDWERISEAQMQPWVIGLERMGLTAAQSRKKESARASHTQDASRIRYYCMKGNAAMQCDTRLGPGAATHNFG